MITKQDNGTKVHNDNLKRAFEAIHDIPAINSQGEPDIDYVKWLEDLIDVYRLASEKSSDISPIIHSQPQDGCYYWVKRDEKSKWEIALAWAYPHGIAFELEGGDQIQYEHIGRWKRTPIPKWNDAYYR